MRKSFSVSLIVAFLAGGFIFATALGSTPSSSVPATTVSAKGKDKAKCRANNRRWYKKQLKRCKRFKARPKTHRSCKNSAKKKFRAGNKRCARG